MLIKEIYDRFGIPQNLREHMLKVTKVGILIVDGWDSDISKNQVIQAGLLHDLANIVKFKLEPGSDLIHLQQDVIEKYGNDDHIATEKMLKELKINQELIDIVQMKSFGNAITISTTNNWPLKILFYSDMRVIPSGVVDFETRLEDVITRLEKYRNHPDKDKLLSSTRDIQRQIQDRTTTRLDQITEASVSASMLNLLETEI